MLADGSRLLADQMEERMRGDRSSPLLHPHVDTRKIPHEKYMQFIMGQMMATSKRQN